MFIKILTKLGFIKKETNWILYDVGNLTQVLTTCIVIFPLLIAKIAPGDSSMCADWANAVYAIILAATSPVLGAMADHKDKRMKMSKFFPFMGIFDGFGLALPFTDYRAVIIIFIVVMLGCNGSTVFYDAFIVGARDDRRVDKVSAAGYTQSYIGSVLPFLIFVIPFALVTPLDDPKTDDLVSGSFTLSYRMACGLAMGVVVPWRLIYSHPILKHMKRKNFHELVSYVVWESFSHLYHTFRDIKKNKNIFLFCISYFLYIDCMNTITKVAISPATRMGISDVASLVVVIVIDIVACPFSILLGKLVEYVDSRKMIYAGIIGYVGVVLAGSLIKTYPSFTWVVALLVGMSQGGTQSILRSYFARLIPDKIDSNGFFGLFSVFSKFPAVLGPMTASTIIMIIRETQYSVLDLTPMTLLGMLFLAFVKGPKSEQKSHRRR